MARVIEAVRGFLLAEEQALMAKLSNITVADPGAPNGRRRVRVYYRHPPAETERNYPFITIDLLYPEFAADRAHSANYWKTDYWPSEYPTFEDYAAAKGLDFDPETDSAEAVEFHPYNLHFTVTTHTRNPQQDRELTALLLNTAYLPDRWGFLHVPADDSYRHLERTGYTNLDNFEGNPQASDRVFRKAYTIRVTAEMAPEYPYIFNRVVRVAGQIHAIPSSDILAEWQNEPEG